MSDKTIPQVAPQYMFRVERRGFSSRTQFKVWLVGTKEPEVWSTWWELPSEHQAVFRNNILDDLVN